MMKAIFSLLFITLLVSSVNSQQCRNANGAVVDWWVVLIYPGSVSTGYAYFDSTFTSSNLQINTIQPDTPGTPFYNTLQQINNLSMQAIAWNDQHPDNSSSSTKAHSKAVAAYDIKTNLGFLFDHSIPMYPAFIGSQINITIPSNQQIYGQHSLCLSLDVNSINQMISKTIPITPYYYVNTLNDPNTINNLLNSGVINKPDYVSLFTTIDKTLGKTQAKFIYKNGKVNGSIFEDGLNNILQSELIAQTWGRPIQDPWCGGTYSVGNVVALQLSPTIGWKQTQDHSKWCLATQNNYACFGDMNRMTSQWKRGGAFYCLNSALLNSAVKKIISSTSVC